MENVNGQFPGQVKTFASVPRPPPVPCRTISNQKKIPMDQPFKRGCTSVSTATRDSWDRLFDEGYRSDVLIYTDNGGIIYAHSNVIGMASEVIHGILKQAKRHGRWRSISICGVPQDAARAFIRFLYSSCYEKEDMEEFAMQLLVLSHVYVVPELKRLCEWHLEHGLLTKENVIDVIQLALLCDAPRLSLISHRIILSNFAEISASEGWKAMTESHPMLEKELLRSLKLEENRQKDRVKKRNEKKMYSELYEAMEALVHICRDGCKTIGPHDKDLKSNQDSCSYSSCKGLESLIRHFAGCRLRAPVGCVSCKRMWQLLELHSRLCADSDQCRVPLCRKFKERMKKLSKKNETTWKLLTKNILNTKRVGGSAFFSEATSISS